jgi:hypothetical protein
MNKEDLDFIHGKIEHTGSQKQQSSELTVNGLPEGKDILSASTEELEDLKIQKQETEKQSPSLEEFEEIDGKDRNSKQKQIEKAKELEELLGIKEANPYRTLNRDIFKENLASMSVAEMTTLATRVGIQPSGGRNQLKAALIRSFDFYAQKHNVTVGTPARPIQLDKNDPNYEESVRLFKEI